jgi:Kdo2-lipid IVA lauroyltransferase/acyltransferase
MNNNNKNLHHKETVFNYYLYMIGKLLAGLLPINRSIFLSTLNAYYFKSTHPRERSAVKNNLDIISKFNNTTPYSTIKPFIAFSKTVAEFLSMSAGKSASLLDTVNISGEDNITQNGRGVIYLSAHSGNWELSAAKIVAMGHPLMVIVQPHPNPLINNLFNNTRESLGIEVYTIGENPAVLYRHLKLGGHIAILGDRDFTGNSRYIDILGTKVKLPVGYFRLAKMTNSVIIPSQHINQTDGPESSLVFKPAIELCSDNRANEQLCFTHIEDIISGNPENWTVFDPILSREHRVE